MSYLIPGKKLLHLREKTLTSGALLGHRLILMTETKLLASHEPRPYLRSQSHCAVRGLAFPEFAKILMAALCCVEHNLCRQEEWINVYF